MTDLDSSDVLSTSTQFAGLTVSERSDTIFHLLDLTDELLLEVFRFLEPDDLFQLGFVCQHLRDIVKDRSLLLKEKLLDISYRYVDMQDYTGALERLDAMKRLFPFYSEVWKERGLCWKDKNYVRRAIKSLRIARRLTKDWPTKLSITAQIRRIQDSYRAAHRLISVACQLDPKNPKFFHFRAYVQSCLPCPAGDEDRSLNLELADYKTVLDIHNYIAPYKRVAIVYNNMGYVHYEQDNLKGALRCFDISLELCPHHVRAFYNRSLVRQAWGHFKKSIADIDCILKINPKLAEVYSLRGWSNVSRGKYEDAADDYRNSLPRTSELDHIVSAYLNILVCVGRIDEALEGSYSLFVHNRDLLQKYREWLDAHANDKDSDYESDDDQLIEMAQKYSRQEEKGDGDGGDANSEGGAIDLNDLVDDIEVTQPKFIEITRTLALLRRIRGELYLIEGKWLLARQLHTEQLAAASTTSSEATSNLLDLMFSNKNAPQRDMVSENVVELTRKMMRECNIPRMRQYVSAAMVDPEFLAHKFASSYKNDEKNVEESLYFVSAFAYKYLSLYLAGSPVARSCKLLENFWQAIRQLPTDSVAAEAVLSPLIVILCLKSFRRTEGTTNFQMLFAIIPNIGANGNKKSGQAPPWATFVMRVAAFIAQLLQNGGDVGNFSDSEAEDDPLGFDEDEEEIEVDDDVGEEDDNEDENEIGEEDGENVPDGQEDEE